MEQKRGVNELLKWLSEKRDRETPRSEEHLLRLESDESSVKIVTIHKSKGLEYPIVFCPFSWGGTRLNHSKGPFIFHNPANNMLRTLDLGSADVEAHRVLAEKELLSENLRLFYVALTRAKNRCYAIWGPFNGAESSAPAYLFHQPHGDQDEDLIGAIKDKVRTSNDTELLQDIETLVRKADNTIKLLDLSFEKNAPPLEPYPMAPDHAETLAPRVFQGRIDRHWRISSYSSLVSRLPHGAEMADRDATPPPEEGAQRPPDEIPIREASSGIFDFPKGTKAGTFFHDIFEHLEFVEEDQSAIKEIIAHKLERHGFDETWLDAVYDMTRNVLTVSLNSKTDGLRLSSIPQEERLNELEFYFPLKKLHSEKVEKILRHHLGSNVFDEFPDMLEYFHIPTTSGFMKGYMDMVFHWKGRYYLVDWKSNFLGAQIDDYNQSTLMKTMIREGYILQYLIYVLALDQYLRLRMPGYGYEKHFGGIYYIFLRGVDPKRGPDYGIYQNLPHPALINTLRETLIEKES